MVKNAKVGPIMIPSVCRVGNRVTFVQTDILQSVLQYVNWLEVLMKWNLAEAVCVYMLSCQK